MKPIERLFERDGLPRWLAIPGLAAAVAFTWFLYELFAPGVTASLATPDARVLALRDLAPIPVSAKRKTDNDGVTVLWKRPAVTEGLADLPWHRDCGMGGHALNCPGFPYS